MKLTKINLEKDDIINSLISEVSKERVLDLEKRLNFLENKYKENENGGYEGLINNIITNKEEAKEFSNFLFKNENINFKLLYQATRDGDQITDIINKIKGYSPTLFLLYTKIGIKCGAYTKALWDIDSEYKKDPSSFLFNFNNKKIFKIKNSDEAIIYNKDFACFGSIRHFDFYIRNNFLKYGACEAREKYSYSINNYEIQGQKESTICELEIFQC